MKMIKDFAKFLHTTLVPEVERQADAVSAITDADRAKLATTYFSREAALLERNSAEYQKALGAAEGLVLSHHGASNFNQLCRSHVRRNSTPTYYQTAALGLLIQSVTDHPNGSPLSGGEASHLLDAIADTLATAREEKSFVKRRSSIRAAIKAVHPALDSDQLTLAVELVIAIDKQ